MAAPLACSNMAVARWITTRILAHLLLLATLATFDYPPVLSMSPTQSSHSESRAAARSCYPPDRDALVSFAQSLGFYNSALNASSLQGSRWTGRNCCVWSGITCGRSHVRHGNSSFARVTKLSWGYESTMSDYNYESPLSASISTSLCNLSALTILRIQLGTYLTNKSSVQHIQVPECVGSHLQLLEQFSCSRSLQAAISGSRDQRITIPASFSRLSKLRSFALDGLLLHSESLDPLLNLPSLRSLAVTRCRVQPLFTLSRLRLPVNLTSLELLSCNLSGPLPAFNQTPFLESVILFDNSLSSTLEEFVLGSHLPALSELILGSNSLSGSLPLAALLQHFPNLSYLDLESNGLTGTLPDQYTCPLCQVVSLNDNKFSGPFPAFINSGQLFYLDLSGNNFSGKPPEQWGHLMSLRWLSLSGNQIAADPATGRRLPHWLFRLPLIDLRLMSTGLQTTDCECHGALSLLNKTLRILDVSGNNLTGPNILNCFALHNFTQSEIFLNLSGNPLSFALSSSYPPPNVQSLLLRSCRLYGPLTAKFLEQLPRVSPKSATNYSYLDLSDNSLSGSIPLQLINQFDYIDLGHNVFTTYSGTVIYSNGYLTSYFLVSHNLLSADLTSLLSSLGLSHPCNIETDDFSYVTLDLSHNNVTGEIPIQFPCVLSRCTRILLNDNSLVGSIPNSSHKMLENAAEIFYGLQIRTLKLNNNELVGVVPPSLLNIIPLRLLDLSHNQLEGDLSMIFSSIKQPTHLCVLFLSYNQISGSIPLFFGALTPQLQIVQLSQNKLWGAIPRHLALPTFLQVDPTSSTLSSSNRLYEEVSIDAKGTKMEFTYELQALTSLDLSGNLLDGEIPSEFGKFVGLRYLNLSRNRLSGLIPSTLSKLSILESMDLSFNQLRGPIPSDFSNLHSLAVFNVSFNPGLEGPIPEGPQISSNTSFEGDPWLCGFPILHPCRDGGPGKEVNQYTKKEEESSALGRFVEEWVDVRGLCLGIVLGFGAVIWARHAR